MNGTHPGDDALSASLDGEATSDEVAHIAACAACRARVDLLGRAADAVGQPLPAVTAEARDAAVLAALEASAPAPPRSLEARRARRQAPRRNVPSWVFGAAAAVLAVAILVPALGRSGGSDDGDQASSAAGGATTTAAADEESATALAAPAPAGGGDLGPVELDELESRVTAALQGAGSFSRNSPASPEADDSAGAAEAADGDDAAPPCRDELVGDDPDVGAARLVASATVEGRPALVLAFDVAREDGPFLLVFVVAADDCRDVIRSVSYPAP